MGLISFSRPTGNESVKDLADMVAKLQKQVEYLMNGNLSSANAREFGGWLIDFDRIVSKDGDVGMSTADTAEDDVRFWAGDADPEAAPYQVRKSGKGKQTGVSIKSKNTFPNIELSADADLLRASASGSSFIEIEAMSAYDDTAIVLRNGGTVGYFHAAAGAVNLLTVGGAGNININSGQNLFLLVNSGYKVLVNSWSTIRSMDPSENETLKDRFNYYDTMISYLTSSIAILNSRISALEGP